jgi:phage N-6-adenine-methyltransferase
MGQQDWATPQDFFDAVSKQFGPFDIDLAATPDNAKCERFINGDTTDSLAPDVEWVNSEHTSCWLNPPFGNIAEWIEKAYYEAQKEPCVKIVVLCRIAPSTKWWMDYVIKSHMVLLLGGKRVQFVPPRGIKKTSNPQECCLVFFYPTTRWGLDIRTWDWSKTCLIS